jgi:hypothetical protein
MLMNFFKFFEIEPVQELKIIPSWRDPSKLCHPYPCTHPVASHGITLEFSGSQSYYDVSARVWLERFKRMWLRY